MLLLQSSEYWDPRPPSHLVVLGVLVFGFVLFFCIEPNLEAAEAPVRGSRSGAARAPLPRAAARAAAEPERGAPHLRPHHGVVGSSSLHESWKGYCFSTVCGDDPHSD